MSYHALSQQSNFRSPTTVEVSELISWASKGGLCLYVADGTPAAEPRLVLQQASEGMLKLDHDLTVSSEMAASLNLGSLWYRLRACSSTPLRAELLPTGELSAALELLAPELEQTALAVCDPQGRLAAANGNADSLLSYVADGLLLGRSLETLLDQPGLLRRDQATRAEVEIPIDRREKQTVEVRLTPHRDVSGRATGWLARFHPRPFLNHSAVDWHSQIEHFPGVVLRLDGNGRVIFVSRRVGGFTVEQIKGRDVFELLREDSLVTAQHFRELVVNGKNTLAGEIPVYDPISQETIWYAFNAVPIVQGAEVEVLVYATDITLRVQAQQELRDSQNRVRTLSSRLDRAQEEERRRISRELHDELGGMLTALRLEVGALEKIDGLPPTALEKLEAVEGILDLTLSTVRRLATQLRPQILDDLGLPAALESLLREASRRSGFEYDFQVPRRLPGSTDLHLHLYRICQEALTNVCRHSNASRVRLRISRPFRDRLHLLLEDNGRGYSPETVAGRATLGLCGIAERVELLAGKLETRSSPGQGCCLKVEVPL